MYILVKDEVILAIGESIVDNGVNYRVGDGMYISKVGEIIDIGDAVIDDKDNYNYINGELVRKTKTEISKRAFIDLFTDDEWKAFIDLTQTNATALKFHAMLFTADFVDLEDELIILGIGQFIVGSGILTADRAIEVLTPKTV